MTYILSLALVETPGGPCIEITCENGNRVLGKPFKTRDDALMAMLSVKDAFFLEEGTGRQKKS